MKMHLQAWIDSLLPHRWSKRMMDYNTWSNFHAFAVARLLAENTLRSHNNGPYVLHGGSVEITGTYHKVPHGLQHSYYADKMTSPVFEHLQKQLADLDLPLQLVEVRVSDWQPRRHEMDLDTVSFMAVYVRT